MNSAAAASTSAPTSASEILHRTSSFLSEAISQPDLRHYLFSIHKATPHSNKRNSLKPLKLAVETIEKTILSPDSPAQSSSLRLTERLLLSYSDTPFCNFLLSLIYTLTQQPISASLSLLNIFYLDPSSARSEIAPVIFQELFLVHILPVLDWFNDQRSRISNSCSSSVNYIGYESDCDVSVVLPSSKLLSKMSGGQAMEFKELESDYGDVLDENCRVFAQYFQEILKNGDGNRVIRPPSVILKVEKLDGGEDGTIKIEDLGFKNGRYNPIWADETKSIEFLSFSDSNRSKSPLSTYPERVSANTLKLQNSKALAASPVSDSDSDIESSFDEDIVNSSSSSESEAEVRVKNRKFALFEPKKSQIEKRKQTIAADSSSFSAEHEMGDADNPPGSGKHTPPKDFVCPITSHLFDDPVTLETGQTYERKAIQEWMDRGHSACPITRQSLYNTQLPKTNYVLKRLVASWKEQNPEFGLIQSEKPREETETNVKPTVVAPITSPNSVISQATFDSMMSELRQAITSLCMSEILNESEMSVLRIEQFWQQANTDLEFQSMLSKPPVINGFVEILFNSVDPRVLKSTVFLLSELGSRDKCVIQTLTRVESDVECIVALFKKGLFEAVVLLYLLRPTTMSLLEMDMVDSLLTVIKNKEDNALKMFLMPKTAAVLLLGQILSSSEESIVVSIGNAIVSTKVIESIADCFEAEFPAERIAAVGILSRCMQAYGKCRNMIADKAHLGPVLDSFVSANDGERFEIVRFFFELVKLNRRTLSEQILHIIKDEGPLSTMHSLVNYLQTALQDQCPVVAGLLLQLDLLAVPRKMSIYREEAIDTLISCLGKSESPAAQLAAAETIMSLQGRFTASGKSLARAFLLKRAGLRKSYRNLMRVEKVGNPSGEIEETLEEENAAENWEKKVAFALVSHEFGLIFEALAEGMKSKNADLQSACFVSATWLVHMLSVLPDTGIRGAARVCLLKSFITIFKSAKDAEDKVLSLLALKSFINDPEGLRDLTACMKDIKKGLRELKKSSPLAVDILNVLSEGRDHSAELWNHEELAQVDCRESGEVLSITCFKDKIFSGHSDGTIKVWTGRGSILHLIQEIKEHTKAVTSLVVLQSGERLYSGSLDRTTRVWLIGNQTLDCVQVHDMKDQVHNLVVANSISCFIPQGAGVKVHSWNGSTKLLNPNKNVKCLTLVQGKLYCGCHDSSVQEIDLATGTLVTIQHGLRKLIGKSNPIHALQVGNGLIYAASSALDGAAIKIWNASNYGQVGALATTLEVRAMVISSELIYLGSKGGIVEIWDQKNQTRVETLQTGIEGARILCMALDTNEEMLVIGTSDGRIQAWGLS
ncbi:putative E3 ubiquitin-protein ligase LIN-1 isoform X2 [Mercurialis annua]|uniref:putative E3 ubiquitin-protein ligase LIN-1 isoform X2 n=1 Tax=Mercurialis annua TaxID=3986 RepID=UPI00215DE025|nr:putative E3 ubiquitin-protein ligase LIN-1 isoform X2 [Mercurialis annua]